MSVDSTLSEKRNDNNYFICKLNLVAMTDIHDQFGEKKNKLLETNEDSMNSLWRGGRSRRSEQLHQEQGQLIGKSCKGEVPENFISPS